MSISKHNEQGDSAIFQQQVKVWSDNASAGEFPDWEEQIRLLSEIGELITPDLTIEEVIAVVYASINQLMDAYQFAVGLYDEKEGVIYYKGMIENSRSFPEVVVDAYEPNRFGPWCVLHDSEIFINDMAAEYSRYVKEIPHPKAGGSPKAAIYVPLHLNKKVAGLITVRAPHKNVYHRHHLYILRTLGNFVMKSWALGQERARPFVQTAAQQKNWRWNDEGQLSVRARKLLSQLTEREKEVLLLLVAGLSNKAMAEKLFVSAGTVKTHTLNIYKKLEVGNRTSAIMKAIELGWFA